MPSEIFKEQLPFAKGKFGYEYCHGRYRIRDSKDDPMGAASTEEEARQMVAKLNARYER